MGDDMRVWIGCLSCYNEGRLVGEWYSAVEARDVTTVQVHADGNGPEVDEEGYPAGRDRAYGPHEELWCLDHEGLPIEGECSPAEASDWADALELVDEDERGAFVAWLEDVAYVSSGHVPDSGDVDTFREAYAGTWLTFGDYAWGYVDDTGYLDDMPDHLRSYFDHEAFARDLRHDYSVVSAPGARVYVFHSL